MSTCNKCGADIRWENNPNGKWVPFNTEDEPDGEDGFPSNIAPHWATCKPKQEEKPLSREARTRPGYL